MEISNIAGFDIEVERKSIKHAHLAVYPPDARIHVSLPEHWTDGDLQAFVVSKSVWIAKQQKEILDHPRQSHRIYTTGEVHYVFGQKYELQVIIDNSTPHCEFNAQKIEMHIRKGTTLQRRSALLNDWTRDLLTVYLEESVDRWSKNVNESEVSWEVKQMRSRWGSCMEKKRHLLFNRELARLPKHCIDYIVLHELIHLKVHQHNGFFEAQLNKFMPMWRERQKELNDFISRPFEDNEFRKK